ncbi:MAG: ABC transporter ATP-binding protein [Deltaproteobacteria bacterium]|nr:ABC transporter ATP-binding protein [Deltaproteobacteria bacterium]
MPGCDNEAFRMIPSSQQGEESLILVDTVSKRFGDIEAIRSISLQVRKGEIFGIVGSDGAGKSTLLRMTATLLKPDTGRILIDGLDVVRQKKLIKPKIGYMPQRFGLYQDLTVEENIAFFMDMFGISGSERRERRDRYLAFSNLLSFTDRLAGRLSGGMKQKLGLACVLIHEPDVLILDEPTNGVDPVSRQEFWQMLGSMKERGMTILISTAYLDEGGKCDRLALMHRSSVLAVAAPTEIQSDYSSLEEAMIQRIQTVDKELAGEQFKP